MERTKKRSSRQRYRMKFAQNVQGKALQNVYFTKVADLKCYQWIVRGSLDVTKCIWSRIFAFVFFSGYIFPTWERNFRSKHGLEPAVSNRGYHGNNAFSDPNRAVFVHPPSNANSMQKMKGGYEFSFPTFLDFLGDWFLIRNPIVLEFLQATNRWSINLRILGTRLHRTKKEHIEAPQTYQDFYRAARRGECSNDPLDLC